MLVLRLRRLGLSSVAALGRLYMSVFERVWPLRQYDDEIDIRELFRIVWVGKWLISGITVGATILAVIYALNLPNIY